MGVYEKTVSKSELDVVVRKMSFPFEDVKTPWFFDDNSLKTVFFAALSSTFPAGEAEFIASVRLFRDQITDKKLKKEISAFIGQEAHHSLQHQRINDHLTNLGLDVNRLDKILQRDIQNMINSEPSYPPVRWIANALGMDGTSNELRLAFTCAAEHLTAIMADHLLSHPECLDGAHDSVKDLLYWHAIEEIEHKSVAYDTYMAAVGDEELLHRAMVLVTMMFSSRVTIYSMMMLWENRKLPKLRELRDFGRFLFNQKSGWLPNIRKPYMEFFKKGFHPWQHNNTALVEKWKTSLSA